MCSELLINLILAHVLGDFYFQCDKLCKAKRDGKFKCWFLYVHPIILGVLSWLFVWDWTFALWALAITLSHFAIDTVKCFVKDNLLSFAIDQMLHIGVIIACCCLWDGGDCWMLPQWCYWSERNILFVLTGALVLCKPANILIKKTLAQYKIGESDAETNRVGSLIGTLERLMAYLFILIGEMSAVGFLLAAKSILRFRDSDTVKTEYVLAGTLLSFGMAVVVGYICSVWYK